MRPPNSVGPPWTCKFQEHHPHGGGQQCYDCSHGEQELSEQASGDPPAHALLMARGKFNELPSKASKTCYRKHAQIAHHAPSLWLTSLKWFKQLMPNRLKGSDALDIGFWMDVSYIMLFVGLSKVIQWRCNKAKIRWKVIKISLWNDTWISAKWFDKNCLGPNGCLPHTAPSTL